MLVRRVVELLSTAPSVLLSLLTLVIQISRAVPKHTCKLSSLRLKQATQTESSPQRMASTQTGKAELHIPSITLPTSS